jgi:hypothetical protein
MEFAAEFVKILLQGRDIEIQFAGQTEESEIIHWRRRLNFPTSRAEVDSPWRAARPTGLGLAKGGLCDHRG